MSLFLAKITFFLKAMLLNLLKMMIAHVSQGISKLHATKLYVMSKNCPVRDNA